MPEPMKVEMSDKPEEKAPEAQKPVAQEPDVKKEPRYVKLEDLDRVNQAINNTREWNNRKITSLEEKIDKLLATSQKPESTGDPDLDELVQKDWKAGVREVARREYEELNKKNSISAREQQELNELEQSKRKVLEKHPELNDPSSEKTRTFLQVLEENPRWKSYTDGPVIAAREMEIRLNGNGKINSEADKDMKEARARATSVPKGTPASSRGNYSLSREDLDFCRLNNINPENYKKYKGQTEATV